MLLLSLQLGTAYHRIEAGHDFQMLGGAAKLGHAALDVAVEGFGFLERWGHGEDYLCMLGGEVLASLRRPGLHDHRMTLRRTRHVQRPTNREILASVV